MKRCNIPLLLLVALMLSFPALDLFLTLSGYQLTLYSPLPLSLIYTCLFAFLCRRVLAAAGDAGCKQSSVLLWLLVPLTVIDLYFALWESKQVLVTLLHAVCLVLAVVVLFRVSKSKVLTATSAVISGIMLLFFGFIAFFFLIFSQIGQDTVVNTALSPDGTYRAEIIDSNQGALGGNTFVEVYYPQKEHNFYFFQIQKFPLRIYSGKWGEFMDMEMHWKDDHTLVINGISYSVP